ncbi:TnsA endonuclease C-terminal domain-containing protein [Ferdinandcohnia quinoae]|uniref:TnsA endonuclease C-terminal domain-containing protein n=1 Tax=Fredinandcohnia quinoae TaxID=2918902 RepID=A0AAW5E7K5_9BACI|nr:TnsA endonuclease C-terminal domain-containing protein [Fredinandcohnia sp. SECRCQ15]MCH1627215.1 TnsA endonuclease C-terminal domain-containing protein [Fredinandcohnia sp. SECRCQ15]
MPVLKHEQTTKKIAKLINEGYGQGEKENYKPFINTIRVSSSGRVSRVKGWITNRVHEFLSDSETRLFYIYEFLGSGKFLDIKEHYPLIEGMDKIVPNLDTELIKRLTNQKTGEPIILTTTFLLSEQTDNGDIRYFARSVKDYRQLENKQVIERYQIMQEYWNRKNVDYGIVTNKEIPLVLAKNIEFIHPFYNLEEYGIEDEMQSFLKERLVDMIGNGEDKPISEILTSFDDEFNLEQGTAIAIYKHMIARKIVGVDMNKTISFKYPCHTVKILSENEVYRYDTYYKHANQI